MPEFYMIYARKINKMPEFYMIFARKINKIPEFYMIYARKINTMPEFYTIFARKNSFCPKLGGGVQLPPDPPVSYAYGGNYLVLFFIILTSVHW